MAERSEVVLRIQLEPKEWSVWYKHKSVPGSIRRYSGPADTLVEFGDGDKVLITEISGNKQPTYRFYSDTGGEMKVLLEK